MAERLQQFHLHALDVIIDQVPPRAWNVDVILESDHLDFFASHIQFMTLVLFQVSRCSRYRKVKSANEDPKLLTFLNVSTLHFSSSRSLRCSQPA
jgi:hypothetical protein